MFSAGRFTTISPTDVEVALPNAMHLGRCEEFTPDVVAALTELRGTPVTVRLIVDATAAAPTGEPPEDASGVLANRRFATPAAAAAAPVVSAPPPPSDEDDVDLSELVDAGDVASTTLDHISRTFPGAELVPEN